ncbi:hypothetical protein GVAV_000040 [Gurleya vavrai]
MPISIPSPPLSDGISDTLYPFKNILFSYSFLCVSCKQINVGLNFKLKRESSSVLLFKPFILRVNILKFLESGHFNDSNSKFRFKLCNLKFIFNLFFINFK